MKIYIVGAGMGAECCLTDYAKSTIKNSDIVITTKRLFDKLHKLNINTVSKEISEFVPFALQNRDACKTISILASGDVGFFSIARSIKEKLPDFEIELVSGISSLQYLTAKLCMPYDDIKVVSVHGREMSVIPYVCYNKKVFALTGGRYKVNDVINELNNSGLSDVLVTVGENLSDSNERIYTDKAKNLTGLCTDHLAVMLIQNSNFEDCHRKIYDHEFIRGKSPMTKEAVRTLCISYLDIKPSDVVIDIGSGTGSVSIEMARKAYENYVFAVEKEDDAVALLKQNISKFGAHNVKVVQAVAPQGMDSVPCADKAFIGGSKGNLKSIVDMLVEKNQNIKIVISAITLETLNEAIECFSGQDFCTEISCVNVASAQKVGKYNMMKAENPIYIIRGEKMQ